MPSPGDLPNPGIELRSPALQVDSLPTEPQGKPSFFFFYLEKCQWNFDGDYGKVMDCFVSMDNIFKMLILPIHENEISFHLSMF